MGLQIGIDIGGTFTDVVVSDSISGQLLFFKVPSTKPAEVGVLNALAQLESEFGQGTSDIERLVHGSTVATNALLEGSWAKIGLVATAGFRDVLEIGRQQRQSLYDLNLDRPIPVVPRERRFVIPERIDAQGDVVTPLDENALRQLLPELSDCEAIAICFLFSYLNPDHEHRVQKILADALDIPIICSADVLSEYREYERCSTTVINAALRPIVGSYIDNLATGLRGSGFSGSFEIMQSNGGLVGSDVAQHHAESLLYSGPAGGVAAARYFSELTGLKDLITFDMGGTSSDISLVSDGKVLQRSESSLGGYQVRVPMADIHSVGAGGGSIAWVDSGGALRVGPQSAGSVPGPACYGVGDEPTVTDAQLVLGRFDPEKTLGSRTLDPTRAERVIREKISQPLGLDLRAAALGILEIADAHMERAIRVISVERGYDPRGYALLAFGGGGPLHACSLAAKLEISTIMIPMTAGVLSALGMLLADVRRDRVQSVLKPMDSVDPVMIATGFAKLKNDLSNELDTGSNEGINYRPSLELRYRGQAYDIELEIDEQLVQEGALSKAQLEQFEALFHEKHNTLYGYSMNEHPTELVNLRMVATKQTHKLELPKLVETDRKSRSEMQREIFFARDLALMCDIYNREHLSTDDRIVGPALIEGSESTILVQLGWEASLDEFGTIYLKSGVS